MKWVPYSKQFRIVKQKRWKTLVDFDRVVPDSREYKILMRFFHGRITICRSIAQSNAETIRENYKADYKIIPIMRWFVIDCYGNPVGMMRDFYSDFNFARLPAAAAIQMLRNPYPRKLLSFDGFRKKRDAIKLRKALAAHIEAVLKYIPAARRLGSSKAWDKGVWMETSQTGSKAKAKRKSKEHTGNECSQESKNHLDKNETNSNPSAKNKRKETKSTLKRKKNLSKKSDAVKFAGAKKTLASIIKQNVRDQILHLI